MLSLFTNLSTDCYIVIQIILKSKESVLSDNDGCDGPPEWGLVELQGKISSPTSTTLHNMKLGDMKFNQQVQTQ